MTDKDLAKQIIDKLPDYKMSHILYLLKGIQFDDEIEDNLFCERMANEYLENKDDNEETIPFEQVLQEAGLTIDDLQN